MPDEQQPPPKVFISYSWTSDEHTDWVGDLGKRLMNDGVDVVLDQWSLEHGHDVTKFMEQMVSDPSIKRVIIVSDALYASKADARQAGVGTETQIISQEVYQSVEQTRFIPLLRERDREGKPCLPIYLKSRKYIDFSHSDNEPDAYDELLRNIYDRPRRRKPPLGKAPSYLYDDEATVVTCAQKATRFRDFVTNGKGNFSAAFEDFTEEFLLNFDQLRLPYTEDQKDTWCDTIRANIASAIAHRDIFVDVVKVGAFHLPSEQFVPSFLTFLERILPFQEEPDNQNSNYDVSEDNYKLLIYELFLYSFAGFVKAKKYGDARTLLDHRYVAPQRFGGTDLVAYDFTAFSPYARSLEEICSRQGDRKRISVVADLVRDRANRFDLRFSDLLQADLLLWIASKGHGWYPRCSVYAGSTATCELFLRAIDERGFAPLKQILNLNSGRDLLSLMNTPEMQRFFQQVDWRADVQLGESLNLAAIRHSWTKSP